MSVATEITRLQNAKAALKSSIESKGVTVPSSTKLDGYPSLVDSIPTGGGGGGTEVELTRPIIYLSSNIIDRDAFSGNPISTNDNTHWVPGVSPIQTAIVTVDPFYDFCLANVSVGQSYHIKFEAVTNINISGTSEFTGAISDSMEMFDEDEVPYLPKRYRIGDLMWAYIDNSPNTLGVIKMTVEIGYFIREYNIYCVNA